ncbi:unnamed protein product [Pleuronectes platessa]|uniref:Uncharacterized protein n=1 Tax=Pleuronectes platessa TaxID=8262 RepID=A0A9N7YBH1_PLEPL|nr:unnamed protein product [Pleuronectes platessa]
MCGPDWSIQTPPPPCVVQAWSIQTAPPMCGPDWSIQTAPPMCGPGAAAEFLPVASSGFSTLLGCLCHFTPSQPPGSLIQSPDVSSQVFKEQRRIHSHYLDDQSNHTGEFQSRSLSDL